MYSNNVLSEIESIENKDYFERFYIISGLMNVIKEKMEEMTQDNQQYLSWDIELFDISQQLPENFSKKISQSVMDPEKIDNFPSEQITFYCERLVQSQNIFFRNHYATYFYEYNPDKCSKNKYEFGKIVIETNIEISKIQKEKGEFEHRYLKRINYSFDIAIRLNCPKLITICMDAMEELFTEYINKLNYRWALDLAEIFRKVLSSNQNSLLNKDMRIGIVNFLHKIKKFYYGNEQYHLHRATCRELLQWLKRDSLLGIDSDSLNKEIGLSYEKQAVYQDGREKKTHSVAAVFYEKALRHYIAVGNVEKIPEIKRKIREEYMLSKKNREFKEFIYNPRVDSKLYQEKIDTYKQLSVDTLFKNISNDPLFIPTSIELNKRLENQNKSFSVQDLFCSTMVTDTNKIFQESDPSDKNYIMLQREYSFYLRELFCSVFAQIFTYFEKEKLLENIIEKKKLLDYPYIEENKISVIYKGFERYFRKDYISSLHILVPSLESLIREMLFFQGCPVTIVSSEVTQSENTLSSLFDTEKNEKVLSIFGNDLHKYIKYILVEKTGFNIRNIIAHGLVKESECNLFTCLLIIQLYIILLKFNEKE